LRSLCMPPKRSLNGTKLPVNENITETELVNNINISINEYIRKDGYDSSNTQLIGQRFCEWVLYNVFELREDEVVEAIGNIEGVLSVRKI